jgi:ferredoxin
MEPRHTLTLQWVDGTEETVLARESQTVFDAAESSAIRLPVGCRTGACATCVGLVTEGRVSHRHPPRALKPSHLDTGYALLCIAEPRTDCVIEVGADRQADLVSNPWR